MRSQSKPPSADRRPSVAVALGGGGARGLAHILVLEVLDELGLRPRLIAGTSIGALVGAAYALGLPAYRLRSIMEETLSSRMDLARQLFAARSEPAQRLLRLVPLRSSLLRPETLLERLVPELNERSFADLSIPLKVVATDLATSSQVVLESGPLRPAVAASIAIPVVFSPVMDGDRMLVDGGLVNPLPFELLDGAADLTIAIDVSGAARPAELGRHPAALDVLIRSIQIMEKAITHQKLARRRPDIYLDVELDEFGALEFWRASEIMAAANPIKERLRRQLMRMLEAPTLDTGLIVQEDGGEKK